MALAIPASGSATGTSVDQMTVGYYIQPGDQIDIIADLGGPTPTSHAVTYAFQDVPVLAGRLHRDLGAASPARLGRRRPSPLPAYFVVEMPRYQAEMMTAILSGNFAQSSALAGQHRPSPGPPRWSSSTCSARPASTAASPSNDAVTPHTVTFTPSDHQPALW